MKQHKILVVDNTPRNLFAAGQILEDGPYQVTLALNSNSGIETIRESKFTLALVQFDLDNTTSLSMVQTIRNGSPETMLILQCDGADTKTRETIFKLGADGADDCIFKPYSTEELLFRVEKNIEGFELKQKARSKRKLFSSCCICKKIRMDDNGPVKNLWMEVEDFLKEETDILLSSTYCPKCAQTVQKDLMGQIERRKA